MSGWGQPQQGWGDQPQQQQGWGQQPQQPQQQGWGQQPQQPQQGWGQQQPQHGFQSIPGQQYRIMTALGGNLCLDMSLGGSKGSMLLWTFHNGKNQKFTLESNGAGMHQIISAENGHCVEAPKDTQAKGTQLLAGPRNSNPSEYWTLVPITSGAFAGPTAFYIKGFSGLYLDVNGGEAKEGTHVIQWEYNGHKNQVWLVVPV